MIITLINALTFLLTVLLVSLPFLMIVLPIILD